MRPFTESGTSPPYASRFWSKVRKSATCWNWIATKNADGYGNFRSGSRVLKAHRVSYELTHGPIPEGLFICHHCDNPACVNPSHLFLGTNRDNVVDMYSKGRGNSPRGKRHGAYTHPERLSRGERHGMAKLDDDKVRAIRILAVEYMQTDIARHFGIGGSAMSAIVRGRTWTHVPADGAWGGAS